MKKKKKIKSRKKTVLEELGMPDPLGRMLLNLGLYPNIKSESSKKEELLPEFIPIRKKYGYELARQAQAYLKKGLYHQVNLRNSKNSKIEKEILPEFISLRKKYGYEIAKKIQNYLKNFTKATFEGKK